MITCPVSNQRMLNVNSTQSTILAMALKIFKMKKFKLIPKGETKATWFAIYMFLGKKN